MEKNKDKIYLADWESLDSREIPNWFADAKFGIFIHWGVYSVPAWRKLEPEKYASYAEWYYARVMHNKENGGEEFHNKNYGQDFQYRDFANLFKAELFDPALWADLFEKSGAKYVVLTTKHHDGFCLWPSKSPYSENWNSMQVGPKRDLVAEISQQVRSKGLKMGLYYSIIEWESTPTKRTPSGYFLPEEIIKKHQIPYQEYTDKHLIPQLKELVENYQPSLIFSDGGEWDGTEEYFKTKEFLSWLYNESTIKDEVVVNDRFAKDMPGKHGDYYSSEYQDALNLNFDHPWEESRGIGDSYGFNRAENIENYRTSKELILELIDIVSRGGNLLLNVGPTADGRIPVIMQERLLDIGEWLKINGEGIYQTKKNKFSNLLNHNNKIYFTLSKNNLYCFFSEWCNELIISDINNKEIKSISLLGVNTSINWEITENKLVIYVPKLTVNEIPCLYAWCFKICFS